MGTWKKLAAAGVSILVPVAMGAGAGAAQAATPVAVWHMEDPAVMTDSSGNGHDGTPQGGVTRVPGTNGNGYHFVDGSIVLVPDSPTLDAGTADITVTARVRFDAPPSAATGDYDLIRKGLAGTPGGEWKMEIFAGGGFTSPAFCLFKDAAGTVASVRSRSNLADRAWHTITCAKSSSQISVTVDGGAPVVLAVALKSISNDQPIGLGQKPGGGDQYVGDMDEVTIEFGAPAAGDTSPPTVTTNPAADAADVAVDADVTATFSEAVKAVNGTNFTLRKAGTTTALAATVSYNPTTLTGTLNPSAALAPATRYTATLTGGPSTGIRDAANNALQTYSWSFTTKGSSGGGGDVTPPTVTAHTPVGTTGISRTANVTATFSEPVTNVTRDTFTLTPATGGAAVAATVTFNSASGRWILNPGSRLAARKAYTATVVGGGGGVQDLAGNRLAGNATWTFTTGA